MDPNPHDDLTGLERRLAGWQPAPAGLNADAMLFAAGQAAGRRGRAWPALTGLLAILVVVLGTWAAAERAGRLALARQLPPEQPAPAPAVPSDPPEPPTTDGLAPNSLFAAHRALEHGLDAWPPQPVPRAAVPDPPAPPVLQAGQRDALLDL
jgi:hypothetical protein